MLFGAEELYTMFIQMPTRYHREEDPNAWPVIIIIGTSVRVLKTIVVEYGAESAL